MLSSGKSQAARLRLRFRKAVRAIGELAVLKRGVDARALHAGEIATERMQEFGQVFRDEFERPLRVCIHAAEHLGIDHAGLDQLQRRGGEIAFPFGNTVAEPEMRRKAIPARLQHPGDFTERRWKKGQI